MAAPQAAPRVDVRPVAAVPARERERESRSPERATGGQQQHVPAGGGLHPARDYHFTPTSSSWLNLERWFAEFPSHKLCRSAHRSVTELAADIRKWINKWNKDPRPFVWARTADEILETLAA